MSYLQNPVQIVTGKIAAAGQNVIIDYPLVMGMTNQFVQHKINSAILSLVYKLMADQKGQLTSQGYQNPQTTVQGWYEIKSNERGILSLTLGNYTFAYPSAHGMTYIKSLTFDVNTGELYQLPELFKPGSNYVKVLSDIVAAQIKQRDITLLGDFTGIRPDQDYYIADKALVIYFQLYEITAYAYGFPMFPISVYAVQDISRENGPLDVMAISG